MMREAIGACMVVIALFTAVFIVGFVAGDHDWVSSTPVCTQESHYITQPYDGGTVHDGRTVYTGDCRVFE